MKQLVAFFFSVLLYNNSLCQNITNNWHFGNTADLNFNLGTVSSFNNSKLISSSGTASISNNNGDLLFYTNGETVWNKNNTIMDNGNNLSGEPDNVQSSIIIPKPGSNTLFYLFTTRLNASNQHTSGIRYSEIEISTAHPLGKVLRKNRFLDIFKTEKLTAVHSNDGKTLWVIAFGTKNSETDAPFNTFSVYKVTENGVSRRTSTTITETESTTSKGTLKASPNGETLALANYDFNEKEAIILLNFNRDTGDISFKKKLSMNMGPGIFSIPYSVAFSPNSKLLYFTATFNAGGSLLRQINVSGSPGPLNSPVTLAFSNSENYRTLQLAPNGKLYVAKTNLNNNETPKAELGVINNPDITGTGSNFITNGVNLSPNSSTKGLPNITPTLFASKIISENNCVGNTTTFTATSYAKIESITWNFNNTATETNLIANHTFATSGKKIIKATLTLENDRVVNIYKEIEVFAIPELNINKSLLQCDDDNDGLSNFNLFNIKPQITNPNLNEDLFFYKTEIAAITNDEDELIKNPENYKNTSVNEKIWVKVVNKNNCYNITSFTLQAAFVQLGAIKDMVTCDDSDTINEDNKGLFNLANKAKDIQTNLNLNTSYTLEFYKSYTDALTSKDKLPENYTTNTTTIWVKVNSDTGCGGIQSFNAIVNVAPENNTIKPNYTICVNPSLKPDVVIKANTNNNRYEWRNSSKELLSTANSFTLTKIGTFYLTTYKTTNNIECANTKEFTVSYPEKATITAIDVAINNTNTITVSVSGLSNYEFSLDNTTFFGNGKTYTFTNVIPGLKTLYVKDVNNCEPALSETVSVIGAPSFFTPNGDGKNDFWNLKGVSEQFYKSIDIQIYNRFGKQLHLINTFNSTGWDGQFKGKLQPENTYWYIYKIQDLDDNYITKTGNFSLIRN